MTKLEIRIYHHIQEAAAAGLTKSELFRLCSNERKEALDAALARLLEAFEIAEVLDEQHKQGRKPMRYYHKDFVPGGRSGDVLPLAPLDSAAPRSRPCKRCGGAIPILPGQVGRPADYCSPECRRDSKTGGISLETFMARTSDFREAAFMLVALDVVIRGFKVSFPLFQLTSLIVSDAEGGALRVDVIPISRDGYFPEGLEAYNCAALVYRDGKIVYAGRNPIATERDPDIDSETETDDEVAAVSEPSTADEDAARLREGDFEGEEP